MLLALQMNMLLESGGPPPSWVAAGFAGGGTAVSEDGTMGTVYLNDVTPVPGTAIFLAGIAHATDGRRYICDWPGSGIVTYLGGTAVRPDGAMCFATTGIAELIRGWAHTSRGEVVVSTSAPEGIYAGFGLRNNGAVCVETVT